MYWLLHIHMCGSNERSKQAQDIFIFSAQIFPFFPLCSVAFCFVVAFYVDISIVWAWCVDDEDTCLCGKAGNGRKRAGNNSIFTELKNYNAHATTHSTS